MINRLNEPLNLPFNAQQGTSKKSNWRLHIAGFSVVAVVVHLAAVWAAPTVIMRMVGKKMSALAASQATSAGGTASKSTALHAPPVTAQSRSIVMPSPEMLYSVCTFDLKNGPLHITANPALSTYWSIALYGANSDNFFVQNDRQANGKPVDLLLVSRGSSQKNLDPVKPKVVIAPTDTGVLLMRVLTGNYEAEKAVLEPARRSLQCAPLTTDKAAS